MDFNVKCSLCHHAKGFTGISVADKDAIKYQSFTPDEWSRSSATGLTLSRREGSQIQFFEKGTQTRLQILPVFGEPQGRRVYLSGAEEDIEAAKTVLAYDVLGRESGSLIAGSQI